MRKPIHSAFKNYMHDSLVRTRESMGINQEEMAHRLSMSTRAYAALEAKDSSCGIETFILFVLNCCNDRSSFFEGLFKALETAIDGDNSAA